MEYSNSKGKGNMFTFILIVHTLFLIPSLTVVFNDFKTNVEVIKIEKAQE